VKQFHITFDDPSCIVLIGWSLHESVRTGLAIPRLSVLGGKLTSLRAWVEKHTDRQTNTNATENQTHARPYTHNYHQTWTTIFGVTTFNNFNSLRKQQHQQTADKIMLLFFKDN